MRHRSRKSVSVYYYEANRYYRIAEICHADNIAPQKVMEKCGFVLENRSMDKYPGKPGGICRCWHKTELIKPKNHSEKKFFRRKEYIKINKVNAICPKRVVITIVFVCEI